jgi:hypothetical protein
MIGDEVSFLGSPLFIKMKKNRNIKYKRLPSARLLRSSLAMTDQVASLPLAMTEYFYPTRSTNLATASAVAPRPTNGAWPSFGTVSVSKPSCRLAISSKVASESKSEFSPRSTITGTDAKAPNSGQAGGIVCVALIPASVFPRAGS